ncbi:hypothetical protein BEL04_15275 [Mucilaginibacter sp. PPCGB 2223]|uniref:ribonuclease E inhibitor RraB n=1 Tax=Mucilaginibacter sp. PPCGB 2223 TaxID=1886027 RepID=UPI000825E15E|nr:ribonuclease E inhibitor RraB [Mucilaginibacter sp. PPCGB 2223]OCX51389.1 hypothetical protein BEL04_15275 [Mucilaginibacter sp. PPCGB 2223]
MSNDTNTYFTKEHFENEIRLDINEDVLKRIYNDGLKPTDQRPINFFFVTDTEEKAILFKNYLEDNFPDYTEIEVWDYEDNFEIRGFTAPLTMDLEPINHWNQAMWDTGYSHDCVLDGWEVETS